jgi:SAM-dependent methyltransferase
VPGATKQLHDAEKVVLTMTIANVDMAAAWDGDEGTDWARDWERYDLGVRSHHLRLMEAAAISRGEHVLDVGCGNGQTTRDAARSAAEGSALGVDLSSGMIARARELARREKLTNVTFEIADAQVHPFEPVSYDIAISRFGAMFFGDPVAAFTNIARGLRPGGRLVLMSWQRLENNEWLVAIRRALAVGRDLPAPPVGAPGPFGLADPDGASTVLTAAGFEQVDCQGVEGPFFAGADPDDAVAFLGRGGVVRGLLQGLEPSDRERALDAFRATMASHESEAGVRFDSASWLISARRPAD